MRWPFRRRATWRKHYERGWSAGSAGDIEGAILHFGKAAALAPGEPSVHYQLGYSYLLLKRYREALDPLRTADQLSRGYFIVQTYIYLCEQVLSGSISAAAVDALILSGHLVDEGRAQSPEAIDIAERIIANEPSCALAYYYLGKALFKSNRRRSEIMLRKCLEFEPDETTAIDALAHIGFHLEAAGNLESARSVWQDILDRYGENAHTNMIKTVIEQRFGTSTREFRPTPDTVLAELLNAHRAGVGDRVSSLCAKSEDVILSNFAAWRKVPPGYRENRAELDFYVDMLVTVAEVFADTGHPELKALLEGDETTNPYKRWSRTFTEAQGLVDEGRYSEVIGPLEEWVDTMKEARGSGVDDLLPKTHGLLGIAYYHLGLLESATDHTRTALSMCERIGDAEGVAIYSASLREMIEDKPPGG